MNVANFNYVFKFCSHIHPESVNYDLAVLKFHMTNLSPARLKF